MKLVKSYVFNVRYSATSSYIFLKQKEVPSQMVYEGCFRYYNNKFINFSIFPVKNGKEIEDLYDICDEKDLSVYSKWVFKHYAVRNYKPNKIKHVCRFVNPMKKYKQVIL